jgi:hypothetical protein
MNAVVYVHTHKHTREYSRVSDDTDTAVTYTMWIFGLSERMYILS